MKFSVLPAVSDGGFWRYWVPSPQVLRVGTLQATVGRALHRRRQGSEVLQLSVDGQTDQMGQTGPDEMEWAIPTRNIDRLGPEA